MTLLHVTNTNNVESTLNNFFEAQLKLIELPSYLSSYNTVAYWPEADIPTPCFSFIHKPVMTMPVFQGNVDPAGLSVTRRHALMEVDVWVTRAGPGSVWTPPLQYMVDMVHAVYTNNPTIVINDYQTDPNYPLPTQYVVRLKDMDERDTLPDVNPAYKRRRMLIEYWWLQRTFVS